jgi:serine/threonine protein kinase
MLGRASEQLSAEIADFLDSNPNASDSMLDLGKILESPDVAAGDTLGGILQEPDFLRGLLSVGRIGSAAIPTLNRDLQNRADVQFPRKGDRFGDFVLLDRVSRSRDGMVFRAKNTQDGSNAVLKFLPSTAPIDQSHFRAQRELSNLRELNHPGIVRLLNIGQCDGFLFLVMEELEGFDLAHLLDLLGPLEPQDACALVQQAADVVSSLHERLIVHRDLKPSNLFLTNEGKVKVIDFGLSRFTDQEDSLTQSGQLLGTIDYMAPEQAFDVREANAASDIYSLGCSLFKLLTGEVPFGAPVYKHFLRKAIAHAASPFPSIQSRRKELSADLDSVIQRCCAKDPHNRFSSAAEFSERLTTFSKNANLSLLVKSASEIDGRKLSPRPEQTTLYPTRVERHRTGRKASRKLIAVWMVAFALTTLLGLATFFSNPGLREGSHSENPAIFPSNLNISTVDSFNLTGNFELDAEPWARFGQVGGKVDFQPSDSKFFRGHSSFVARPRVASVGPGPAIFRRVQGLTPGETYVLSAGFETSAMTGGKLGVDVSGPGFYHRLTPAIGCEGWQFCWLEFIPTRTFANLRLVYDSETRPGDEGYFDSIAITPKAKFQPLEENAVITMQSKAILENFWTYHSPVKNVTQFEFNRNGLIHLNNPQGEGLTLEHKINGRVSKGPFEIEALPAGTRRFKFLGTNSEALQQNLSGEIGLRILEKPDQFKNLSEISPDKELLTVSPDGAFAAIRTTQDQIEIWNIRELEKLEQISLPNEQECKVELSYGAKLIAIHQDNWLGLFSLNSDIPSKQVKLNASQILGIRFCPKSEKLMLADSKKNVRLYSLPELVEVARFQTSFALSGFLELSPNSRYLLLASNMDVVWLYDLKTHRPVWWTDGCAGYFSSASEIVTAFRAGGLSGWRMPPEVELPKFSGVESSQPEMNK